VSVEFFLLSLHQVSLVASKTVSATSPLLLSVVSTLSLCIKKLLYMGSSLTGFLDLSPISLTAQSLFSFFYQLRRLVKFVSFFHG
jgi:hypothetical protein